MGRGTDERRVRVEVPSHPAWPRYGVAIVLTTAVSLGARELEPFWDMTGHHPYLIEWPTIIAAAWFGGLGPGLLAVALSTLAILFYWIEPTRSLAVEHPSDLVALTLFAICGVVVSVLIERLHRALEREHKLRRAREVVLGVVAHDLRNPLNSVVFGLAMLRRKPADAQRLDTIERATRRMESLIRDLVDASRLEADESLAIALGPETVASMVDESVAAATLNATAKSVAISTHVVAELRVHCDRDRILQVLGNLLDNAVKFTPEGGRITVRAVSVGALVRVEVSDSGPGIKPEQHALVFKRHWSGRGIGAGAGLGLFIAHGIVRAHGGHIWLHSEPGHGTTFFLTLPAAEDVAPAQERRPRQNSDRFQLS
jgi:signal transduction histidine kinase